MNRYLNGMLTNEEVIQELLNLAKQIAAAQKEGDQLGLTADELAFYDALTKPQAIKDFYEHEELIAITKELTGLLRQNRTIDWQKKESARAGMRRMIKRLLKKYHYPPEEAANALETVIRQCEQWTDNDETTPTAPDFIHDIPQRAKSLHYSSLDDEDTNYSIAAES